MQLPDTIHTTVDGIPHRYNPTRTTPALTNEALPLTCGHRFAAGDIIWFGRPADETVQAETHAVCGDCVEHTP